MARASHPLCRAARDRFERHRRGFEGLVELDRGDGQWVARHARSPRSGGRPEREADCVSADELLRTAAQRRDEAFQELLRHVTLPKLIDPELQDDGAVDETPEPDGPVTTVLNIVIDAESAGHGLEQLLGTSSMAPRGREGLS